VCQHLEGGKNNTMQLPSKKPKYPKISLSDQIEEKEAVEYHRFILNLDEKLIDAIEKHIFEEKRNKVKLPDVKTGKDKMINRSLWARQVFAEALKNAGVEID
jgi:hypothetical protein